MKNSTRRVSMFLAIMMVLSLLAAFPSMVAGAADTNYALNITPTVTKAGADLAPSNNGTNASLTDGVLTTTSETVNAAYYGAGAGNLVEFTFNLGSVKTDISSVYVFVKDTYILNSANNRGFDTIAASVEISTDGATYTKVTGTKTYTQSTADANYRDFTYAFTAAQSAQYVKVILSSTAWVLSISEIEIRNYGLSEGEVVESTDDPTLVDGNYAYGASYSASKVTTAEDGTETTADPAYRNAAQTDGGNWLTDGYVGSGAAAGSNYYTVAYAGTSAKYVITMTLSQSYSDIAYITLENVMTAFSVPLTVAIKSSTDGITYNDVTFTEVQAADAGGAMDVTYHFASAVSAQYLQFSFTYGTVYCCGFDEFVVGGSGTAPELPSVEPEISASADVKTSTTATNYAASSAGAYYMYSSNSSGLPFASYTDDAWVGFNGKALGMDVFGQGDLNNGVYATGKHTDNAWVGFAHSEQWNTINSIEIIFDLAAVYGDIDQIVANWLVLAGEGGNDATYADPVNGITVSFGDYEGVYGTATKVYPGTITETAGADFTTYKAQFAVGDLTGNVRFVKISFPKPDYRLFIDEIEVIGASGYDIAGSAPESSDPSSEDPSSEDPSSESRLPGEGSYVVEPGFDVSIAVDITTVDPDGEDGTEYTEQQYAVLDLYITNINPLNRETGEAYGRGINGIDGYLYFDEAALVPVWYSDAHLNGVPSESIEAKTLVSWSYYTVKVPGTTITYNMFAYEGVNTPYATLDADGNLTNTDAAGQGYTMGKGYIRVNYMLDIEKAPSFVNNGIGMTDADAIQLRYYFSAKDGSFDAGESFYFAVPDNPDATTTNAALLKAPTYTGATDNTAMTTTYGRGDYAYLTIPEAVKEYTVTFVDKDGNQIGDAQTVVEGGAAVAPEAPVVEGYTFTGWDVAFDNVTSDLTVTAQYEQIMVTVTFEAGVGGTLSGTTSVSVAYGTDLSTVTFPTATADEGYEFDAWSATSGIITVDTTVTASFKEVVVETADFFTFAEGADTTYVVVSTTTNYIYFKAGGYTADAFKALFADENITITKANGTTAVSGSTLVGTTCLATSTINGQSETREIVVFGDISGDGKVNGTDYGQVKNCAMGRLTLSGAKRIAANINKPATDTIDASDYAQVKNFSMGRLTKFNVSVS